MVVKSTAGYLTVYDLDTLSLIKKIKVGQIGSQDEGFAFTPDGKYLYNIEKPIRSVCTQITIYRTSDFKIEKIMFKNDEKVCIKILEFDSDNKCYVLGFVRNDEGVYDYGFIGELVEKGIKNVRKLNKNDYDYIRAFKDWEDWGFTEREHDNLYALKEKQEFKYISLSDVYKKLTKKGK